MPIDSTKKQNHRLPNMNSLPAQKQIYSNRQLLPAESRSLSCFLCEHEHMILAPNSNLRNSGMAFAAQKDDGFQYPHASSK